VPKQAKVAAGGFLCGEGGTSSDVSSKFVLHVRTSSKSKISPVYRGLKRRRETALHSIREKRVLTRSTRLRGSMDTNGWLGFHSMGDETRKCYDVRKAVTRRGLISARAKKVDEADARGDNAGQRER
jgi:hypothetical protein